MPKTKQIRICDIIRSKELQGREDYSEDHQESIAEHLKNRGKLKKQPKVVQVTDRDNKLYAVGGHHSIEAYVDAGRSSIPVEFFVGTWQDARDMATSDNTEHNALPRTRADKRRVVRMALEDHPDWGDPLIASHCKVSPHLVATVRETIPAAKEATKLLAVDGKMRPTTIRKPTPKDKSSENGEANEPEVDPASVKAYFRGKDAEVDHPHADLLKAIVSLATKVSKAVNDAEADDPIRQYLLNVGFVWARDKIVDGKKMGWQCVGLRGLYRVINLAGKPGLKNKNAIVAAYEAANRGEE